MVQARSSLCRAIFFLTAIDGGMIHSFVRQQNRTPWRRLGRREISGLNWRNRLATTSLFSKRLPKTDVLQVLL